MSALLKSLKSFRFAFRGLKILFTGENNIKIHSAFTIAVVVLGLLLKISLIEWELIIICIGLVYSAEAFNSAVERIVDLISPEQNHLAGVIKDLAAGAVLITAIAAFIVGLIIFIPKLLLLI